MNGMGGWLHEENDCVTRMGPNWELEMKGVNLKFMKRMMDFNKSIRNEMKCVRLMTWPECHERMIKCIMWNERS